MRGEKVPDRWNPDYLLRQACRHVEDVEGGRPSGDGHGLEVEAGISVEKTFFWRGANG